MEHVNLRILARSVAIAVITCLCPGKTQAGDCPQKTAAGDCQAFLFDANYAKPLRWNVGASLFFSHAFSNEGGGGPIVSGPSTNSDHIITWSVGAEIPWFR